MKIYIVEPFYSTVLGHYNGYSIVGEYDYNPITEYQARQWVKRYNRYANANLTIKIM